MIDVFDLCRSDRFLAGGAQAREKSFEFPPKRPWIRRVTTVDEYLRAVTRDPDDEDETETAWHILEERYLSELLGVTDKVSTLGCGPFVEELNAKQMALSNLLASTDVTRPLAEKIGRVAQIDGERLLMESLGESPYSHLRVVLLIQELFPQVVFPLVR